MDSGRTTAAVETVKHCGATKETHEEIHASYIKAPIYMWRSVEEQKVTTHRTEFPGSAKLSAVLLNLDN